MSIHPIMLRVAANADKQQIQVFAPPFPPVEPGTMDYQTRSGWSDDSGNLIWINAFESLNRLLMREVTANPDPAIEWRLYGPSSRGVTEENTIIARDDDSVSLDDEDVSIRLAPNFGSSHAIEAASDALRRELIELLATS